MSNVDSVLSLQTFKLILLKKYGRMRITTTFIMIIVCYCMFVFIYLYLP